MLQGMDVDENPLDKPNLELERQLEVVYEDEWLAIVNKPSGMLSAPGKIKAPCVSDILPIIQYTDWTCLLLDFRYL